MRGDGDLGLAELTPEIIMELIDRQVRCWRVYAVSVSML